MAERPQASQQFVIFIIAIVLLSAIHISFYDHADGLHPHVPLELESLERNLQRNLEQHNGEQVNFQVFLQEPRLKKLLYWKKDQLRDNYSKKPESEKYLAFDTWRGGFNNERMSVEFAFVLAYLTNRTLVIPPPFPLYLLTFSALEDYFDIEDMKKAVPTISWAQFYRKFPQLNEKNLDGIERVAHTLNWTDSTIGRSVYCHPKIPTNERDIKRLKLFAGGRAENPLQSEESWKDQKVLFIKQRVLLGNYYQFFFFSNVEEERRVKHLVKNYLHYNQRFFEAADKILNLLPVSFSSFHLRKGDFQFKDMRNIDPPVFYNNIRELFDPKEALYAATDERDQKIRESYFSQFKGNHSVYVLDDFAQILKASNIEGQFMGMIEQIICAQSRLFVGTRLSTFSSYITRLRAHMGMADLNTYVTYLQYPSEYKRGYPIPPWNRPDLGYCSWCREYSTAWEDWEHQSDLLSHKK
eukprot:TRINITY_DN5684_c0_g1_i1.p1 TRINITY_DN5684_c0_g1~~TRINITY_DN5684_c0_g1_i1.p1  ORF type:complete len:480 (-),score=112.40 TRINITY_DN5684_c0_g1_i1:162-1565(-)